MKPDTRKVIEEMKAKKQYKKDNGPIEKTADELWKYSGEIEEENEHLKLYNAHHDKAANRSNYEADMDAQDPKWGKFKI
jgi:hypothetical protein